MPGEGETGGGGGGGGSGGGGSGGPNSSDIAAILAYLRYLPIGKDGDFTGNAGYFGDNIGPVGSKEPEKDEDQSTALINALMMPPGRISGGPPRPRDVNQRSRETEPYSGAIMPRGSLFAFAGADVDVYSGLPLGIENPDPFTGLPVSDPFADIEWPTHARRAGPFATIRRESLLSSPYLLAENNVIARDPKAPVQSDSSSHPVAHGMTGRTEPKWQEVVVNNDPGARYHIREGSDVIQRDTANFSERYHQGGGDQAVIFADDKVTVYTENTILRDMKSLTRLDFYIKYKAVFDAKTLDLLTSAMPKPELRPPAEDKQIYMGASGRLGTAEDLAESDLAEEISNVKPFSTLGAVYSAAAVALGGDAKEAVRMGRIGDAWSPIFSMAAGAIALKQPQTTPASQLRANRTFGEGKRRLELLPGQHFTPNKSASEVFQGFTIRVASRLEANPSLIPSYLTPSQNRFSAYGPWAAKIVFGNAVEDAMATGAQPTGLLNYTGNIRPFKLGGADFVGAPGTTWAGYNFQVTTEKQWYKHWLNDEPGTIYGTYR